eukprot:jgi/Mesvir1/13202/Mv06161-RA.1
MKGPVTLILLGLFCSAFLALASRNFYDILQVPKSATPDQIKRAYRKLALQYHPDKNPGDEEASRKFADINNAYEALSDPEKRKIYDRHGEEGLKKEAAQDAGGGGGFHDIFSSFFGGGMRFGFGGGEEEERTPKGEDVILPLRVTLKDLYLGSTIVVHREKVVSKPAPGKRKCNCKNKMVNEQIGVGMFRQYAKRVCEECNAVRYEREGISLTVDVERGMKDGQEIVFFEEGEPLVDGEPGDLKFRIEAERHPMFERRGNDLHITVVIRLTEALVGFTHQIEHLDGHKVEIGHPGVTKPGEVRTIKGEGMPIFDSTKTGNLVVTYNVAFPSVVTDQQKKAIRAIGFLE